MSMKEEDGDAVRSGFRELSWLQAKDRSMLVRVWRGVWGAGAETTDERILL